MEDVHEGAPRVDVFGENAEPGRVEAPLPGVGTRASTRCRRRRKVRESNIVVVCFSVTSLELQTRLTVGYNVIGGVTRAPCLPKSCAMFLSETHDRLAWANILTNT